VNKRLEKITLLFIVVVAVWVSSNISWGKDRWKGILESDARGYYAYLPAFFIYQDQHFDFFEPIEKSEYSDAHYTYDYRVKANGATLNKYWMGTAICEAPFFLAAHGITSISGEKNNGYSKLYPIFINLAGIAYAMIGLFFLMRIFNHYGFNSMIKCLSVLFVFFGTNLFYYAVVEPGMSHVFSFAVITIFFYLLILFFNSPSLTKLFQLALLIGLIFLIRPQNIMVICLLPFAAGSKEKLSKGIQWVINNPGNLILALILIAIIGSFQFIYYKLACGIFFADSYPGESFNFLSPHISSILFSYKKGLFLYTPFYLICLFGLYFFFKHSAWEFFSIAFFFILITYVFSSWHNWWYGGSFSSRVYVDYLIIFAISFGMLLHQAAKKFRVTIITISILLTLLCQFQTYQYRYNIIHWESMTKELYWQSFFQFEKK
jgi:hypothetical protein